MKVRTEFSHTIMFEKKSLNIFISIKLLKAFLIRKTNTEFFKQFNSLSNNGRTFITEFHQNSLVHFRAFMVRKIDTAFSYNFIAFKRQKKIRFLLKSTELLKDFLWKIITEFSIFSRVFLVRKIITEFPKKCRAFENFSYQQIWHWIFS